MPSNLSTLISEELQGLYSLVTLYSDDTVGTVPFLRQFASTVIQCQISKVNKFDSTQNRFFGGKWTLKSFLGGVKMSKTDLAGLFPWFSGWNNFLG